MKKVILKVKENKEIADRIYKMILSGDTSEIKNPGQFIDLKLPDFYLRRPISVSDYDEEKVTIIYKVLGRGTELMTSLPYDYELDVLTGLGNGFDISKSKEHPLLIGGGVGIPPLYKLAKVLALLGKEVKVALGFNSAKDSFYIDEFKDLGCLVSIASTDGSIGVKGVVTDAARSLMPSSNIFTCGPMPMLRSVYDLSIEENIPAEFSFEERMGCGFGACMGCSVEVNEIDKDGSPTGNIISKRICKDGPVLSKEEIRWE